MNVFNSTRKLTLFYGNLAILTMNVAHHVDSERILDELKTNSCTYDFLTIIPYVEVMFATKFCT